MTDKIPVRQVDTQEYMKIVKELLAEGREVPLVVTGNSMLPFLVDRRDQVLIRKNDRPLEKGDIAFFQRENGQYIMHRIRFIRKDDKTGVCQFYFIGDNQLETEGPIAQEQIFGVVTQAVRKGKRINEKSFIWKFFKHIWIYVIPFRQKILKIYSLFKH